MRQLTIKEIIAVIPLKQELRAQLLAQYDTCDEAEQFEIQHVCWQAFGRYKKALESYYYHIKLREVQAGSLHLEEMAKAIDDAVWQDIEDTLSGKKKDAQQIEHIHKQIEDMVRARVQ